MDGMNPVIWYWLGELGVRGSRVEVGDMVIVGDPAIWVLMLGIVALLVVYWAAKWVISLWTGA